MIFHFIFYYLYSFSVCFSLFLACAQFQNSGPVVTKAVRATSSSSRVEHRNSKKRRMTTLIPTSQQQQQSSAASVAASAPAAVESYEDMFKEITRKLYGEESAHGLYPINNAQVAQLAQTPSAPPEGESRPLQIAYDCRHARTICRERVGTSKHISIIFSNHQHPFIMSL